MTPPKIKNRGQAPGCTQMLKLQTQQADGITDDTDNEEAHDDPQRVDFLTQQPHTSKR
ncbi:hypothetical protein D3C75_1099700 [compost metagenome]